ncbi:MAG: hypothetical protein AAF696_14745 [Bacteroidota bacterium]
MAIYDGNPQDYQPLIQEGYDFNLGRYLRRGWDIFTSNSGGFIGYVFIFFLILFAMNLLIAELNFNSTVIAFVLGQIGSLITASLAAGFIIVAHKVSKEKEHDFGSFFEGFQDAIQLWLGNLVSSIIASIPILLGVYLGASEYAFEWFSMLQDPASLAENMNTIMDQFMLAGSKIAMFGGLGFILYVILNALFSFTQHNIIFGRMKFWDAMETSRKIISQKVLQMVLMWMVLFFSYVAALILVGSIASATGSFGMGLISGLFIIIGSAIFFGYVYCVQYAAYEDIVFDNVMSIDDRIDDIGME